MRTLGALLLLASVSIASDWPQWMGPGRDGVWKEEGILDAFPAGGPKKLWSAPLGSGYSGPAVAKGRVYAMDYTRKTGDDKPDPGERNMLTGTERIFCFDIASGKEIWHDGYDCPYHVSYPAGPRCTPTVHDGKVYALGTMGNLTCLDAAGGKVIWKCDFKKEFAAKVPIWGFCGHPLIYKNMLICLVGGPEALIVAFDKDTGDVKWKALTTSEDDGPGYCPPSIIEAGGVTQLLVWSPQDVISLNPDHRGDVYWKEPLKPNHGMSIMMPQKSGDLLYVGGIGGAALAIKLESKYPAASVAWRGDKNTAIYPSSSTPLVYKDVIYGIDWYGYLRAVKLGTGARLWESTFFTMGTENKPTAHGTAFLVRHEDRFFIFNEKGHLILAKLTPEKYEIISQAKLIEPTTPAANRPVVWSHPAFAEKCIFVRNDRELACFSLAK